MQIASMSGRSSRSTLTHTNRSFMSAAIVRVLERLVRHHVAPVAGRVADRDEQRAVLVARPRERLLAPRLPVDRVVLVLQQVRRALAREAVRHDLRLPRARCGQYAVCSPPPRRNHCQHTASRSRRPALPRRSGPTSTPCAPAACCSARARSRSIPKTGELVGATAADQAGRCLENLAAVCDAAGATLGDAVRLTVYLTDMAAFAAVNEVYGSFFESDPPARVAIAVAGAAARRAWSRSTRWWRFLTDTSTSAVDVADMRRAVRPAPGSCARRRC